MENNYKEEMCNELSLILKEQFGIPMQQFKNIFYYIADKYNIDLNCTDLVKVDNTDDKIINKYIVCKKIEGLSNRTLQSYASELRRYLKYINYQKKILDMTTDDIRVYLADGALNRHWSGTHSDNIRRILSAFYSWCVEEDLIIKNPVKKIKTIKQRSNVRIPFTEIEIEKMRDYITNNSPIRDRAIFELLLSTGCRVSELCNIKIQNVNLKSKEIKVLGKGNKERIVYLNEKSVFYLQKYLDEREKINQDPNDFLFYALFDGNACKPLKISGVEIMIRKLGKSTGVEAFPHKFRHTAATLALKRGMPIEQVRIMLGHNKIETTLIYAQSNTDDVKQNHNKYMQ